MRAELISATALDENLSRLAAAVSQQIRTKND